MGRILATIGPLSLVNWWDFKFEKFGVDAISPGGVRYMRGAAYGMPKIPRDVLESVFYLYRSREDAEQGEPFGGTGVFLGMPTGAPGLSFLYAVTNWHVAVRDGFSVMRFNKRDGGVEILEFDPSEWEFPPKGADIAVLLSRQPGLRLSPWTHQVFALSTELFLTKDDLAPLDPRLKTRPKEPAHVPLEIGPGEDVFMVGRFVDHDGRANNVPSVRFGNVSTMPQPIEQPTGATNPSFILDLHSRTGYSGSAVFVYRTPGADLTVPLQINTHFIRFLGLHWGQFPEQWEIRDAKTPAAQGAIVSGDERYVKGMSGMTMAVPAWEIWEFLQMPAFQNEREIEMENIRKSGRFINAPDAETATEKPIQDDDANPSHREDFNSLLGAAARKREQED